MKNKLLDLNNALFAQIERLNEEGLTGDQLTQEVQRSRAIEGIAKQIISNANTGLDAVKFAADSMNATQQLPEQFKPKPRLNKPVKIYEV